MCTVQPLQGCAVDKNKLCKRPGCARSPKAKGLCHYHYNLERYPYSPVVSEPRTCDDCGEWFTPVKRQRNFRCKECMATYRKEYARKWREDNNDHKRRYDTAYRAAHTEERRIQKHNRRSKMSQPILTMHLANKRYMCHICGGDFPINATNGDPLYPTIDHVWPLSKGGTNTIDNIEWAHASCNFQKSDKTHGWDNIRPVLT